MSYVPVPRSVPGDDIENQKTDEKTRIPDDWHGGPHTLRPGRLEFIGSWAWGIALTLTPTCFFGNTTVFYCKNVTGIRYIISTVLAILALRLDEEPVSPYGQRIVDFTRLSPTIYPILFAALASRFFKNLARWRLETRDGVELATLEQISGSQSLAGAVERLLFVRAHVLIGIFILLTWSLSPLGGQSAARVLHKGKKVTTETGFIYFRHPHDHDSYFSDLDRAALGIVNVNILYTSSLIASSTQKGSPVDLWGLPKIPQWPRHLRDGFDRRVDMKALAAGDDYYTSLLGVKIHGLSILPQNAQYDFTVETLYYDFDCGSVKDSITLEQLSTYMDDERTHVDVNALYSSWEDSPTSASGTFVASISLPNLTRIYPNIDQEPIPLNDVPPGYMLYATLDRITDEERGKYFALFNCTVRPEVMDTSITCKSSNSSTSCQAARQKRVNGRYRSDSFYHLMTDVAWLERAALLSNWRTSDNARLDWLFMSPTDNYLARDSRLFARQEKQNWANVSLEGFSSRLTTAFNTYWEASLDPFNHTDVDFREQPPTDDLVAQSSGGPPPLKQTEGVATVQHDVYRANRQWIAMLIITTVCLEILAVSGALLQFFIHGPDILGFASSLTRENPHVGLPPGGSGLDGPARARALRHLRVQLSDISPKDEVGYVALKAVASPERAAQGDDKSWRPLNPKRPYL